MKITDLLKNTSKQSQLELLEKLISTHVAKDGEINLELEIDGGFLIETFCNGIHELLSTAEQNISDSAD